MYEIVLLVNAPPGTEHAVKEHLGMYMERFGDTKIVSIKEIVPEQMQMGFMPRQQNQKGRK